jgi:hypothetical protein
MFHIAIRGQDFTGLEAESIEELRPRMVAAVSDGVDILHAKVTEILDRPGRSQPGEAPGRESGELLRSIKSRKPTGRAKLRATGRVYTRLFWAERHEYGGRAKGEDGKVRRFPMRPFFRPAIAQATPEIEARFEAL